MMAENSRIEWTDHTVNFWWGCTKLSPACLHCYAERQDAHFHPGIPWPMRFQNEKAVAAHWGPNAPRMLRVQAAAREARRYEARALKEGRRFRVFTNSMSDFFEDRRDLAQARAQALLVIQSTPSLDWLLLTKRPERILQQLRRALEAWKLEPASPASLSVIEWLERWLGGHAPANVWLGATVEDQERADQRIPALLGVPARVRFLSCEPLLGPADLNLQVCWLGYTPTRELLHWVIAGGESGTDPRPMHPGWARSLRDQCAGAGVPFLFKGWGEWAPAMGDLWWHPLEGGPQFPVRAGGLGTRAFGDGYGAVRIGKAATGRLLDGQVHDGYPELAHA